MFNRMVAAALVAVVASLAGAGSASATTREATFGACRVGAQVFEHWTAARHIGYDDNSGCYYIGMRAIRRCWGSTYTNHYGPSTADTIDRQWTGCDGISTKTTGYRSTLSVYGSVEAIA